MNIDNFFQSVEENGASLIISSQHQNNNYVLSKLNSFDIGKG